MLIQYHGFPFVHFLFLVLSFISGCTADPINHILGEVSFTTRAIIGSLLIGLGLILVLFGKHVIKLLLFVSGAVLFGISAFLISRNIVSLETINESQKIGIYVGCSIAALVGGVIALWCVQLGIIIIGGVLGFAVANIILRFNVITDHTYQIIFISCMVVGFAILAFLISSIIMILATSIIGATLTMYGVDMFALTGFGDFILSLKDGGDITPTTPYLWLMIISLLVLAVLGILIQLCTTRCHKY